MILRKKRAHLVLETPLAVAEAQGLRHARDYVSGFQPSSDLAIRHLGLRPRLVCRRTYGPHRAAPLQTATVLERMETTRQTTPWQASKLSRTHSSAKATPPSPVSPTTLVFASTCKTRVPKLLSQLEPGVLPQAGIGRALGPRFFASSTFTTRVPQ